MARSSTAIVHFSQAEDGRFPWHRVDRPTFDLDAVRPVLGLHFRHEDPGTSTFDMHYELELGIVRSGRMVRRYQGWQVALGPGQVWLCASWEPHGFHIATSPCEVAVLVAAPEFVRGRAEAAGAALFDVFQCAPQQRPRRSQSALRPELRRIAAQVAALAVEPPGRQAAWARLLLEEALLLLTAGWQAPAGSGPQSGMGSRQWERLQPALRLAFGERRLVTEEEAAAACAMSCNGFCRHFRAAHGLSFARFALRHRLRGAALDIRGSIAPLKAIAADWGFVDISHFHRTFSRHYGCTPAEYRSGAAG